LRHLHLHQLLHDPAKRLAQEVKPLTLKQVADDLLSRHPLRLGHRGDSSRQLHWREADDHERHGGRTPSRPRPTPSYTTLRDVTLLVSGLVAAGTAAGAQPPRSSGGEPSVEAAFQGESAVPGSLASLRFFAQARGVVFQVFRAGT